MFNKHVAELGGVDARPVYGRFQRCVEAFLKLIDLFNVAEERGDLLIREHVRALPAPGQVTLRLKTICRVSAGIIMIVLITTNQT